jgi:hypothetical protein
MTDSKYTFKVSTTRTGLVVPTVSVNSDNLESGRATVIREYAKLARALKKKGYRVAGGKRA